MSIESGMSTNIDCLPEEILIIIFNFLPFDVLLKCNEVCLRWSQIVQDPAVWKTIVIGNSDTAIRLIKSSEASRLFKLCGKFVQYLTLKWLQHYEPLDTSFIFQNCPNVTTLKIANSHVNKVLQTDLLSLRALKQLTLKDFGTYCRKVKYDEAEINFEHFKYMETVILIETNLTLSSINQLRKLSQIREVHLENTNLNVSAMEPLILNNQKNLINFYLREDEYSNYQTNEPMNRCVELLTQCLNLQKLHLYNCDDLTDNELRKFMYFKKLKKLTLTSNALLTEQCLLSTFSGQNLVTLESLLLTEITNVTSAVFDVIKENCINLEEYYIYVYGDDYDEFKIEKSEHFDDD